MSDFLDMNLGGSLILKKIKITNVAPTFRFTLILVRVASRSGIGLTTELRIGITGFEGLS